MTTGNALQRPMHDDDKLCSCAMGVCARNRSFYNGQCIVAAQLDVIDGIEYPKVVRNRWVQTKISAGA